MFSFVGLCLSFGVQISAGEEVHRLRDRLRSRTWRGQLLRDNKLVGRDALRALDTPPGLFWPLVAAGGFAGFCPEAAL